MKQHFRPVLTKESEQIISSYYQLQRRSATDNAGLLDFFLIILKLFAFISRDPDFSFLVFFSSDNCAHA